MRLPCSWLIWKRRLASHKHNCNIFPPNFPHFLVISAVESGQRSAEAANQRASEAEEEREAEKGKTSQREGPFSTEEHFCEIQHYSANDFEMQKHLSVSVTKMEFGFWTLQLVLAQDKPK